MKHVEAVMKAKEHSASSLKGLRMFAEGQGTQSM